MSRRRDRRGYLPAGNWPPYVEACFRKAVRFRVFALAVSALGAAFFGVALWCAREGEGLLGISAFHAAVALLCQCGVCVFLALDLRAARLERRGP